jgi:SAM-dependent methyltransferase
MISPSASEDSNLLVRTAKEAIRHLLHITHAEKFFYRRRNTLYLQKSTLEERFTEIYRIGIWTRGNAETPLSGTGSSLEATIDLRSHLPALLSELGGRSLLDVGCGDFTWMNEVNLGELDYTGVDIVPAVVENNNARFARPKLRFLVVNAIKEPLPSADIVLCREVLFHLSFEDAFAVLRGITETGAKYAIITTDSRTTLNSNITSGDFRLLNLHRWPFNLPPPICLIDEGTSFPGRGLGCWRTADIRSALPTRFGSIAPKSP